MSLNSQTQMAVLDSKDIRKEIFKFNYQQNKGKSSFELNEKADAFEVLDLMLSMLHAW